MAAIPKISSLSWKIQDEDDGISSSDSPKIFVHITDYPGSILWIWIGDSSAELSNLSFALKSRVGASSNLQNQVNSTTVMNPTGSDEATLKSKSLAHRLSKLLGGRPVYLSYSISAMTAVEEDLLCLPDLETKLFQYLKANNQNTDTNH